MIKKPFLTCPAKFFSRTALLLTSEELYLNRQARKIAVLE